MKFAESTIHADPFRSPVAKRTPHVVSVHPSPGDYVKFIAEIERRDFAPGGSSIYLKGMSGRWAGGEGRDIVESKMVIGDSRMSKKAQALISKLDRVDVPTPKRKRIKSPVGGRACVPAYLAGAPNAMRRRPKMPSNRAPLSVTVDLVSSSGVSKTDMQRRGVAVAALVSAIKRTRPVTLYLVTGGHEGSSGSTNIDLIKFPTAPLDLKRLVHLCAAQGIPRGLAFYSHVASPRLYHLATGTKIKEGKASGWCEFPFKNYAYVDRHNDAKHGTEAHGNDLKADLADFLGTEVLHIPGVVLKSRDQKEIMEDPIKWVNRKVKEHMI